MATVVFVLFAPSWASAQTRSEVQDLQAVLNSVDSEKARVCPDARNPVQCRRDYDTAVSNLRGVQQTLLRIEIAKKAQDWDSVRKFELQLKQFAEDGSVATQRILHEHGIKHPAQSSSLAN